MLLVIRDGFGQIEAACAYHIVDELGEMNQFGKYVYVDQLEVSNTADGTQLIGQVICKIATLHPQTIGAYWERRDKTGMRPHGYRRGQLMRWVRKADAEKVSA